MYIKIEVFPESKEERVVKKSDDAFLVAVREKAEAGVANRRAVSLLRQFLNVPEGKAIRIVSGHHSSHKIISIE